jgi:hypothetical protein
MKFGYAAGYNQNQHSFEILSTNLPKAKEDDLRAAFGAE